MLTTQQLSKICPGIKSSLCTDITALINEFAPQFGLTNKEAFRKFLANVAQESLNFSHKSENMNYTTAARIMAVWPGRFPTVESALPYVKNPIGLANKSYGGRMGNTEPNDGWTYRGAGFIGITGKEMYTKYAKYLGIPVEEAANLMRTQNRYALHSAFWFFCIHKGLTKIAATCTFKFTVKAINGGYVGLADREKYYARCKAVILD